MSGLEPFSLVHNGGVFQKIPFVSAIENPPPPNTGSSAVLSELQIVTRLHCCFLDVYK